MSASSISSHILKRPSILFLSEIVCEIKSAKVGSDIKSIDAYQLPSLVTGAYRAVRQSSRTGNPPRRGPVVLEPVFRASSAWRIMWP